MNRILSQNERGLVFRQLNYQWLMANLRRDNEEHNKSVEEQVIGCEEHAEKKTHDEDKDVIPNFVTDDDNGDDNDGPDGEYEYERMKFYKDCGYLKFNNWLCLHCYDGLLVDVHE